MPAVNKLTIAALLAITVSIAGCNSSKKASSTATDTAAAQAASAAAAIESAAAAGSAPAAAGTSAPAAGGSAAACSLTGAQATTVMGETYANPTVAYGICSYLSSDNAFTINVNPATGDFDFNGTLATAKQDQGTDTSTTIPGLGDRAAGTGQEIVVQSGGKTIDIRNVDEAPWTKSIALAKLVIASLK